MQLIKIIKKQSDRTTIKQNVADKHTWYDDVQKTTSGRVTEV